jgi:5'-nucleotidase / UDP-sugar diphosphatase
MRNISQISQVFSFPACMKITISFLISLMLSGLFTNDIRAQNADTETGDGKVVILHVNDMHSQIDHLGKLKYLADSLRDIYPNLFLVSAGDNFTGNPVVDMYKDPGAPLIDLMNRCGFTVSVVGNHEFDMGQKAFNRKMKKAGFPFICANFDASDAVVNQPWPYIVLETDFGVEIPMLGLIQLDNNGLPSAHPKNLEGIQFRDGLETARGYSFLKEEYGILLVLSHLGVDDDIRLAEAMPFVDAIIGGHTHTTLEDGLTVNGVFIAQASARMRYIGKMVLTFDGDKLVSITDELIPVKTLKQSDPKMDARIKKYNNNRILDKEVAVAPDTIMGKAELGSMMCDAITSEIDVDIAFQNRGGIRVPFLLPGPIRLRDIYKLDPFGNQVVTYDMTTREIATLICNAFNWGKKLDLEVSGITYTVLTGQSGGCAGVHLFNYDGTPLDPEKTYKVAMNSYMATTYTFDNRDSGVYEPYTGAELLIQYLEKQQEVDYRGVERAKVQ